jgi:6-phosphogluconolactonase
MATASRPRSSRITLHVGTYTGGASKGIYRLDFDTETGALGEPVLAAEAINPAFLAWHPRLPVVYSVSETATGPQWQGRVIAFAAAADGSLTALNEQLSGGAAPCHVSVDPSGARVFVANYHGGSVAALPIDAGGRLQPASSIARHSGSSVHPVRQRKPYGHSIVPAPAAPSAPATAGARAEHVAAASFAVAADLGADRLIVYRIDDATGLLTSHDDGAASASASVSAAVAPGAGPRHLAFTPSGDMLFAINELNSTVAAYAWDATRGTLERAGDPVSTLPADFTGENITAEIAVHPGGKFLYGSNRGHDSIAIFRIGPDPNHPDPDHPKLDHPDRNHHLMRISRIALHETHGKTPRHFAIDPAGAFLIAANQDSDSLVVFRIDAGTGLLSDVIARASIPSPSCVRFRPSPGAPVA